MILVTLQDHSIIKLVYMRHRGIEVTPSILPLRKDQKLCIFFLILLFLVHWTNSGFSLEKKKKIKTEDTPSTNTPLLYWFLIRLEGRELELRFLKSVWRDLSNELLHELISLRVAEIVILSY